MSRDRFRDLNPCVAIFGYGPEGAICFDCKKFLQVDGASGYCEFRQVNRNEEVSEGYEDYEEASGGVDFHYGNHNACAKFELRGDPLEQLQTISKIVCAREKESK